MPISPGFAAVFSDRIAALQDEFIGPLDRLSAEVQKAELACRRAQNRHREEVARLWSQYQPGYERSLHHADAGRAPGKKKWWHHDEAEPEPESVADGVRTIRRGGREHARSTGRRTVSRRSPRADPRPASFSFDRADEVSS